MTSQQAGAAPKSCTVQDESLDKTECEEQKVKNTLSVKDNRTGKTYEVPILKDGFVEASEFKKFRLNEKDLKGIMVFDPGFTNTAVAESEITFIDGSSGTLRYRGYNIEDLAENASFLEVAYLLIFGDLPTKHQYNVWNEKIMGHTYIHENLISLMKTFRYDAHPMGILISSMSALSTFYEDANPALKGPQLYKDATIRNKQIFRILGKLPTIAACAYRHRIGRPYNNPVNHLGYTDNFLYMMDRLSETNYRPHPKLARALDILFIIHADHEMNNSTAAMRHVGSTLVDPYTAIACASGALYGPLHGGANEQVLNMLNEIGDIENIPQYLDDVRKKKKKLMGFGHRVYKNFDPRANIIKKVAEDVFKVCQNDKKVQALWKIANELEKQALNDQYFIDRKLFPNIDFYSGLIYKAMGFPPDMFPVLFSIPRAAGWLAHWMEAQKAPNARIYRPGQMYSGPGERKFIPMESREKSRADLNSYISEYGIRRAISISYFNDPNNGEIFSPITTKATTTRHHPTNDVFN